MYNLYIQGLIFVLYIYITNEIKYTVISLIMTYYTQLIHVTYTY